MGYRTLSGADQPEWRRLRLEALELYPQNFITTAQDVRDRAIEEDIAGLERGNWRGIFEGAQLIGMAALIPMHYASAAHRAEIGAFYVTPAQHGSGAARQIMDALEAEARAQGIWQLELFVAETNPRGLRFYERHGFVRQGLLPNAAFIEGVMTSDIFMTCDLRS